MEFHEKLQELRKQRGITQEEVAQSLYVSRTAVSKWESGRGYPNIDSLKAIAKFYGVSIDELLSGDELMTIAEEDHRQTKTLFHNQIFGLLDIGTAALLFLPFFAQATEGKILAVPLLSLTAIAPYLKAGYFTFIAASVISGILTLVPKNRHESPWAQYKHRFSLLVNIVGEVLFIISQQPYAAIFLFLFLGIKVLILTKKQ